jgi:hypothetical protein
VVSVRAVDMTARAAARALGWTGDGHQDEVVWAAAFTAWGLVEGACRGRGCPVDLLPTSDPPTAEELAAIEAAATAPADLGAVALAATLRLAPNPAQRASESTTTEGVGSRRVEGSFAGFTLAETLVLNRYRRRVR